MLNLKNVTKSYDDLLLLKEVSLDFEYGEAVHISGPNGSGKTTLLKMICGLTKQDEGSILISDNVKIGALIENPSFITSYTAQENLKLLYNLTSKSQYDDNEMFKLFEYFGLDYSDKRKISKYSLGMLQKVGIIQAIMENQNLIILDEPTRGIDDEGIENFCLLVNEYVKNGKTIIIASHDMENISSINFTKKYVIQNYDLKIY